MNGIEENTAVEETMAESREHFPETHHTFVLEALDGGRDRELASHVMLVYYRPLCAYFRATTYRALGEAEEIVGGFFASRLSDPTWLARWRAESEARQVPLRRWLLNGLCFYLREESRRQRRDRAILRLGLASAEQTLPEDDHASGGREAEVHGEESPTDVDGVGPASAAPGDASRQHRPRASGWLRAGLSSVLARVRRQRSRESLDESIRWQMSERMCRPESVETCASLERRYEAERARRVLALAVERARAVCSAAGQARHFEIFMRHHVQGVPYEIVAPGFGLHPTQCGGMARTAGAKFRAQLCAILREEGVDPHDLDREIARLQEALAA